MSEGQEWIEGEWGAWHLGCEGQVKEKEGSKAMYECFRFVSGITGNHLKALCERVRELNLFLKNHSVYTSYVVWELQIKITMRCHYTPITMAKIWTTPWQHQMLARMWSNRNFHSLLVGIQTGTATLENSWGVCYKTKNIQTIWSSNQIPWYFPKGVKNVCPQENLHMDVYSNLIHNWQYLEATKMSFGWWVDK